MIGFGPIDKMTDGQLVAMVRWHESFAEMWNAKREPRRKEEALHMAAPYRKELERRKNADTWDDPDR